jgi:hypothetical protein
MKLIIIRCFFIQKLKTQSKNVKFCEILQMTQNITQNLQSICNLRAVSLNTKGMVHNLKVRI